MADEVKEQHLGAPSLQDLAELHAGYPSFSSFILHHF